MMPTRVRFLGQSQAECEEFILQEVGTEQVHVQSICSLLSTGTETIAYSRLFESGSHWDGWVKYPFYPGYATIGRVVACGSSVDSVKVGQRVAVRTGHASDSVVDAADCFPLPGGVIDEAAAWFALAKITSMGARAAQYQLGDSVLIIGAGPIGQLATRWASASGVETILVADLASGRLEHAKRGGATAVFDRPIEDALPAIIEANHGNKPRVVIDSTGHAQVFASALKCVDRFGRVVILGDTGAPTGQHLTSDVILRGLTIVGAHDGHEGPGWDAARIYRLFFRLLKDGRFDVEGLITHRVPGREARAAYELAMTQRMETMGILLTWDDAGSGLMSELLLSASEWSFLQEGGDVAALYQGMKERGYGAIEMPSRAHREAALGAGLRVLNIAGPGMQDGTYLNRDDHHAELLPKLRGCLEDAAAAGIPQVIFFSGNREGVADDAGRDACIRGAKALASDAERLGVTLTLEVLNRFDHPDYQADSTAFAMDVVRGVSSPNVKLLYDIYHMDRMGESVLDDIVEHLPYIAHLHVAGSPERDQPTATQRIDYATLVRRALDAGYTGHWGMEFLPEGDPLPALDEAAQLFRSHAQTSSA